MTPEKAILILKDASHFHFPADGLDFRDAVNLGAESLKRLQFMRQNCFPFTQPPLPGETGELNLER